MLTRKRHVELSSLAPGSGRLHSLTLVEPRSASPVAPLASESLSETKPTSLTLLVRAYCHLCDEMREAVAPLAASAGCPLREIDIDSDPALEARWGERVPVLLAGESELCHYRVDRAALAAYLAGAAR